MGRGCAGRGRGALVADSRAWRVEVLVGTRLLEALVASADSVKLDLPLLALESPDLRNKNLCRHANVRSIVEK